MNKRLVVILSIITLDAIGIGLIFPILPSLLKEVTGSGDVSLVYGVILALYSLAQFVFSPVLGALSDRFGRDGAARFDCRRDDRLPRHGDVESVLGAARRPCDRRDDGGEYGGGDGLHLRHHGGARARAAFRLHERVLRHRFHHRPSARRAARRRLGTRALSNT